MQREKGVEREGRREGGEEDREEKGRGRKCTISGYEKHYLRLAVGSLGSFSG